MTTLQLFSDLHLEVLSPARRSQWLERLDPTGVDVVVLAGDICTASEMEEVLGAFCQRYPEVIYVLGNHEYYGSTPKEIHQRVTKLCAQHPNLHWLDNRPTEVAGLRFVGGTLWFDQPSENMRQRMRRANVGVSDFRRIRNFVPWVYQQNQTCREVLEAHLSSADVVVTHHIPAFCCISPRYLDGDGLALNHYFCSDMTPQIEKHQPPLWVFGHTHDRMCAQIGHTNLVSNPLGYPREPESWERGVYAPRCLIEINEPTRGQVRFIRDVPGPGTAESR